MILTVATIWRGSTAREGRQGRHGRPIRRARSVHRCARGRRTARPASRAKWLQRPVKGAVISIALARQRLGQRAPRPRPRACRRRSRRAATTRRDTGRLQLGDVLARQHAALGEVDAIGAPAVRQDGAGRLVDGRFAEPHAAATLGALTAPPAGAPAPRRSGPGSTRRSRPATWRRC